ncbi:MAG: polyprenyl synthetase family protein [Terracidiphilus sp.]|nr:polyprenyl synthetase family protein [Terracidiphilus sp.]
MALPNPVILEPVIQEDDRQAAKTECKEATIPACAGLETAYRNHLPLPLDAEPHLRAALGHLLDHPGSMVRPHIVFRMATAYGIEPRAALELATALEYFHTASLVFDDLPCMDNASVRRGAPCTHVVHGESEAILAALALINRAYALAWRAAHRCPQGLQDASLNYLESHLGVNGLLNGQSLDLNFNTLPHTPASTARVARGKTVALIELTLCLPAMLGGATGRELQLLERLSNYWGLAYQMVDDLKDVLESGETTGKTSAQDAQLGRPNAVLEFGIAETAKRLVRILRLGDRTLEVLLQEQRALGFLRDFRSSLNKDLSRVLAVAGTNPAERTR